MPASSSPLRALRHYRVLPEIIGWPSLIVAFLARAPFAMIPLGVMTAFAASTGDIRVGGLATGITSLSTAFSAPVLGRVAERVGQRPLLLVTTPLNAGGLLGLYLLSLQPDPTWILWVLCVLTGSTALPVGSFTRARWVSRTTTPYQLAAAFSYESMADELVFVLGPALVGIAASLANPSAPLAVGFVLMLAAGIPFALTAPRSPLSAPAPGQEDAQASMGSILRAVALPIATLVFVGMYFGSTQAATTVRAEMLGEPGSAGLVYATMGLGSAISALLVVTIPDTFPYWSRLAVAGTGMAAGMVVIAAAHSLPATAVLMGLTGFFVGPTLVTAFSLTEALAPPSGITVAMMAMSSSVTVGVAVGSSLGGAITEAAGPDVTFYFAAASAAVLVGLAGVLAVSSRRGVVRRNDL